MQLLNQEHFRVLVFVGANQTKISLDIVLALQEMGERTKYIKISGNGSNALDFHAGVRVLLLYLWPVPGGGRNSASG
ncbi:MAG: PIN domain-containing protein [Oscillochloridaceae bacterium umkhey_bin13]